MAGTVQGGEACTKVPPAGPIQAEEPLAGGLGRGIFLGSVPEPASGHTDHYHSQAGIRHWRAVSLGIGPSAARAAGLLQVGTLGGLPGNVHVGVSAWAPDGERRPDLAAMQSATGLRGSHFAPE